LFPSVFYCVVELTMVRYQVLERIMDEVSFTADDFAGGKNFQVTPAYVRERVSPMLVKSDLSKYIL